MLGTSSASGLNPISVKWISFWSCEDSWMLSSSKGHGGMCATEGRCTWDVLAGAHTEVWGMPWGSQHIPRDVSCPTTYTALLNTVGTFFWITMKLPGTLFPAVICKKASFLYLSYKKKTTAQDKSYFPLYSNLRWHWWFQEGSLYFCIFPLPEENYFLYLSREQRIPDVSGALWLITSWCATPWEDTLWRG